MWPDASASAPHHAGVDALSYGLATLVMGNNVFCEEQQRGSANAASSSVAVCGNCGCTNEEVAEPGGLLRRMRRGNHYAHYTRKFSVGNGPYAWVQEYSIGKETGKMLGTLVALAVARMVNLESFVWDMPTGVLREIWIALASLADRKQQHEECRLERVWVRWHDNSDNPRRTVLVCVPLLGEQQQSPGHHDRLALDRSQSFRSKYAHVEYPTLSVLPPLKSLSVLDIDEASYLEEMGVLIERSRDRLRELRIGIALKIFQSTWLKPSEEIDPALAAGSYVTSNVALLGWPRPGGVLGILLDQPTALSAERKELRQEEAQNVNTTEVADNAAASQANDQSLVGSQQNDAADDRPQNKTHNGDSSASKTPKKPSPVNSSGSRKPNRPRLKLETLELERVSLSIPVMLRTFDWSRLTTLTILRCEKHEKLWKALARQYAPVKGSTTKSSQHDRLEYPLKIKNIHTDSVSSSLLLFIKEAVAPNSLESVFLQESPGYFSTISVDRIFRCVLQGHRLSLRKVLLDSTERASSGKEMASSTAWKKWLATREILSFLTSGMPRLRELGIAMHSKDWVSIPFVFFLFPLVERATINTDVAL